MKNRQKNNNITINYDLPGQLSVHHLSGSVNARTRCDDGPPVVVLPAGQACGHPEKSLLIMEYNDAGFKIRRPFLPQLVDAIIAVRLAATYGI